MFNANASQTLELRILVLRNIQKQHYFVILCANMAGITSTLSQKLNINRLAHLSFTYIPSFLAKVRPG